jgi:hypothetical protein
VGTEQEVQVVFAHRENTQVSRLVSIRPKMDSRYGADQSGFLELQSTSNAWFLVLTKSLAINFDFI